jgi:hypothetical protein
MKLSNLHTTKSGYELKSMILNESRTVIIGKVQDKDQIKENPDIESVYISTKWDIDRENKICKCQLGIEGYDISLENKYIPGLTAEPKPKKNFYTFKKDAWHCKVYKWVFGKEPHKVHPTMCPYFWIMVVVFLTFPLILLVKMTGKMGANFIESCSTYSKRMDEKRRAAFVKSCLDKLPTMTDREAYVLTHSKIFKKYQYELHFKDRYAIEDKGSAWYNQKCQEEREERMRRDEEARLKREIRDQKDEEKYQNKKVREVKIEEFKQSKTSKIIGIGLVVIMSYFIIWGLGVATVKAVGWINWKYVGYAILTIASVVAAGFVIYISFKYVINPSLKWTFMQMSKINPPKIPSPKMPVYKFGRGIGRGFKFLFGWVEPLFRSIVQGIIYMVDFFGMVRDLIHSMYKKNCPVITWTDDEQK